MAPGRTAAFAASIAVVVVGISVWGIARPGSAPDLHSPASASTLSARKVASVATHDAVLPQRPEPPEMRRIVQRMIFR